MIDTINRDEEPEWCLDDINPFETIQLLFERLNQEGIRYCHWKSNYRLKYALICEDDIDLFVAREDSGSFIRIMTQLGFKQAISLISTSPPGVQHFLNFEQDSGRIIHVHTFFRIHTGDSLLKSFTLPFGRLLLDNIRMVGGNVPIPTKEAELIVFVLRTMIKHASFPDLVLQVRDYKSVLEEFKWLEPWKYTQTALTLLREHFPEIDERDFQQALEWIPKRERILLRIRLGWKMSRFLGKYRRFTPIGSALRSGWAISQMLFWKYFLKQKSKILASGGTIIAFVGPQATGKTTLSRHICLEWLGSDLAVQYIHAGKPPSTWLTILPNLMLPLVRKLMANQRSTNVEMRLEEGEECRYSLLYVLRRVMLAHDRKVLLKRSFRLVGSGRIVISDRYPSEIVGAVDGPTFTEETIDRERSKIKKLFMKWEKRIYQRIPSPDLVFQLTVPEDVAVKRDLERDKKGFKDPSYVRFKHRMKNQPVFKRPIVYRNSTNQSLEKTIKDIQAFVWKHL